ncbi:MAG: Hsp20/alpha crystallin family protein [Chloroflexi bacterium]|nr:MAG: Hsp20/alpha crystallin family protein [Chloroflexota bacterium]
MWWSDFDDRRTTLLRELERIMREWERPKTAAPAYPALNVWANPEGLIVTAELPGVEPEDIEISIVDRTLTLSGTRRPDTNGEGIKFHRRERGHGKFTRTLQLPFGVEKEKVDAIFNKGVLSIILPRAEAEKPRKVKVKAA